MEMNLTTQEFAAFADTTQDAIVIMDSQRRIIFWNKSAEKIFQYTSGEVIGKELHKLLPYEKAHRENTKNLDWFAQTGKSPVLGKIMELSVRRKNGERFEVELSVSGLFTNGEWLAVGFMRDVSERKRAQEAMEKSQEKYKALFMATRDAVMTLESPSWKFTSGNPVAVAMFGAKDEAEFISYGPWKLSPEKQPDGRLSIEKSKEMIDKCVAEGVNLFEWKHKRINGEEFFAEVLLSKVEQEGNFLILASVRDITERKKVYDTLERLNQAMVGRELKMIQLKRQIDELTKKNEAKP